MLAGDSAIIVEFGDKVSVEINTRVRSLSLHLEKHPLKGIKETVPTYRSLMIHYDPIKLPLAILQKELEKGIIESAHAPPPRSRKIIIPVKYGGEYGPDIKDVADYNKISSEEVINVHTSMNYLVYMIGFTPGFPYLGEVPSSIKCPRLTTPRVRVPSGSVGIAGTLTGIYSVESPGGWRLIGRTPLKLFDQESNQPFLLQAGDYIKFRSIDDKEYEDILNKVQVGKYQKEIQDSGNQ